MAYKGAFECAKCPQTGDTRRPRACPAWWETRWTDEHGQNHEARSCAFTQLPHFLNTLARSANGAAVSAQEARNSVAEVVPELQRGFRALALACHAGFEDVKSAYNSLPSNPSFTASVTAVDPANHPILHSDRRLDQQPGQRRDDRAPNGAVGDGTVLLRHDAQQTDMVEQFDLDLEGRNRS